MKITLFIGALHGGGAERVACNLMNDLVGRGHSLEVITMTDSPAGYPVDCAIRRVCLLKEEERKDNISNTILRMHRLRSYLKERKDIDAYVVILPVTIVMFLLLRSRTKAKVIISERNDPTQYSGVLQFLLRRLTGKADGIVLQTEVAKKWYENCLGSAVPVIIPNAINPAFLRAPYAGERQKVIAAAGRLSEQKNFPLLIRAFSAIAEEFPEYTLRIYGKGALLPQLTALAGSLGIGDRVEFPGYVQNMPEQLERVSMFVMSSDYEGMPNALIEAMALGLPCVSTDCGGGGAGFLIENGVNGLLVPVKEEQAMAEAMREILRDSAGAAHLGENARKLQNHLSPDRIYGQWESFIRQIVEG